MTASDSAGLTVVALAVTNCWLCCSLQSAELSRTRIPSEYGSVRSYEAMTLSAWRGSLFLPFTEEKIHEEARLVALSFSEQFFVKMWKATRNDRQ